MIHTEAWLQNWRNRGEGAAYWGTRRLGEIGAGYPYGNMVNFLKENPENGRTQMSPIRPVLFMYLKEFANYPLLTAGFVIYRAVRYSAGFLGFLLEK